MVLQVTIDDAKLDGLNYLANAAGMTLDEYNSYILNFKAGEGMNQINQDRLKILSDAYLAADPATQAAMITTAEGAIGRILPV